MFDVGRVCVKIAGRDAGQKCVVVKKLEGKYVLIDGMTRRRKCNTLHLEPTDQMLDIQEDASHEDIVDAFKEWGLEARNTKPKAKTVRMSPVRKVTLRRAREEAKEKTPKKEKKENAQK